MRILGTVCLASVFVVGLFGCDSGGGSGANNAPLPGTGNELDGEGGTAGTAQNDEPQGGSDNVMPEGGSSDPGNPPGGMVDGVTCDRSGFSAAEQVAGTTEYGIAYQALAPASNTGGSDVMLTQIYTSFDGPTQPGVYSLDGINFRDCGLCLLMQTNCSDNAPCEKTFYADEGSVEIISLDDEQFAARYDNVVYREVTISQGDSTSTPVAGGETWCMNGYSFDQPLQAGGGGGGQDTEQICAGPVACMGEEVGNFSVLSCETNETVNVRTYFEGAEAALFLGTAGWCPACSQRVPQVVSYAEQTPGLRVMYILGEDRGYNQPTQSYCQNYARSHNVPISQIFIDHDGEYGHANFFTNMWPYPVDNMIGLPYHAVMDPEDWTYVYGDGGPSGDLNSALSELLQ